MSKYIFNRRYKCSDGEIDDENVWVEASSKSEALSKVKYEYPRSVDFTLIRTK